MAEAVVAEPTEEVAEAVVAEPTEEVTLDTIQDAVEAENIAKENVENASETEVKTAEAVIEALDTETEARGTWFWVNYSIGWNLGRWDVKFRTFWSGNQSFCLLRPETETSERDLRFGGFLAQIGPWK